MILSAANDNEADPDAVVQSIGPALVFERLWRESGFQVVIRDVLETRGFRFDVERAVFLTVLHRIMASGSDRSALKWRESDLIDSADELELQHLYRAMAWPGEELDDDPPQARFPRRIKDRIEEKAFAPGARICSGGWISSSSILPRCFSPARAGRASASTAKARTVATTVGK